ncbi:MAG TPA: hypothetical protein VM734_17315 [Kofleriaceae bacterium]|nr:hypothetical protein [Kofleriaceae bacterium]
MMRAVAVGISLALSTAACGSGASGGPAIVAGAPAGDVVEVAGKVTATRSGAVRDLAAGAEVSGDDVIETGADGRVTIKLRHNQVPWTLGPGRKEQVGGSLAWKAPKATGELAAVSGDRSTAAGRHAEREAADTGASADLAMAPAAAAAAPAAAAEPPAAMEEAEVPPPPPSPPPPPIEAIAERTPKRARGAAPAGKGAKLDEPFGEDLGVTGGLGLTGTGEGGGGAGGGIGLGNVGTIGKGGGTGAGAGGYGSGPGAAKQPAAAQLAIGTVDVSGGLSRDLALKVVKANHNQLRYCAERAAVPEKLTLVVELSVGADGKVTGATVQGVAGTLAGCLRNAFTRMQFPVAGKASIATVELLHLPPP